MMRRSPSGWRARRARHFPRPWSSPAGSPQKTALWREPAPGGRPSTAPASGAPASRPRGSCRASELSYNNYADADAAFELVAEFAPPGGRHRQARQPVRRRHRREPARGLGARRSPATRSARLAGSSRSTGRSTRRPPRRSAGSSIEVVIAPAGGSGSGGGARPPHAAAPAGDRRHARPGGAGPALSARSPGGFLVQERDRVALGRRALCSAVTKRAPSEAEIADLLFADTVAKHVKSNAIVFARGGATVGIGAGQPSRVDSVEIAARKAAEIGWPPVCGSRRRRARCSPRTRSSRSPTGSKRRSRPAPPRSIQPGGSVRDAEVIAAADAARHRHGLYRHPPLPALSRPIAGWSLVGAGGAIAARKQMLRLIASAIYNA